MDIDPANGEGISSVMTPLHAMLNHNNISTFIVPPQTTFMMSNNQDFYADSKLCGTISRLVPNTWK